MTIRTHMGEWAVFADWHGEVRPVYRGSIFDCIAYRASREAKS